MNAATQSHDSQPVHPIVYLKDYQPPIYLVESVNLNISIFANGTLVNSSLVMKRQTAGAALGDLVLLGRDLELLEVCVNGQELSVDQYRLDSESLTILNAPDQCVVDTQVRIHPQHNTQLEGLYQAGDLFVTQNEPEGFRKITFFPDRPDVLSVFTTRLEADQKYPTLLANGNLIEVGDASEGRHYAIWQDPTQKPSYLFACVVGDLAVMKDCYTTIEGRAVSLELYTEAKDLDKCHVGMQALKDSMQWDEQEYGRAYDLDNYMIVAVSQFNMGAMENKGLNIFNTACVLSDPQTTTDPSNFYVKSTIAHEYFHNWTGNRITCRDWFQLCLKEGFTVFRDQSFSETLQSPAVQRIDDVASLKSAQFAEDAGPMSHPPRPDQFVEINNFYTATVYDKGAEIARMIATLLGKQKFRQGTDEYFRRHDGQAVTVEDLLNSLSDGSGVDVRHFLPWYTQAGTPTVSGQGQYDAATQIYRLTLRQSVKPHAKYPNPKPLPIPVSTALFERASGRLLVEQILLLDQPEQSFVFENIAVAPVASLLRDFSAPVLLDFAYSDVDLAFLVQHETNGFNQWQAAQALLERVLLQGHDVELYLAAMAHTVPSLAQRDALLTARLLDIPSENYLASRIDRDYAPSEVHQRREVVLNALAKRLAEYWPVAYAEQPIVPYVDSSEAMGRRAWRNVVLSMAFRAGLPEAVQWASEQYQAAVCMTERLGALRALVWNDAAGTADLSVQLLVDFEQRFSAEALAIDLWFSLQSGKPTVTVAEIQALLQHPRFDYSTPNRVRSVTSHFAQNPLAVWTVEGVQFYADLTRQLDSKNPLLASRILQTLSRWYSLKSPLREQVKAVLQALQVDVSSSSVTETLGNLLQAE